MSPLLLLAAAGGGIYLLTRKKTASNAVTGKSGKPWIVEMLPKGSAGDVYYQLPATSHAYQLSSPAGTFGPHDQVVVLTYRQDGSDMNSRRQLSATTGLPAVMAETARADFGVHV